MVDDHRERTMLLSISSKQQILLDCIAFQQGQDSFPFSIFFSEVYHTLHHSYLSMPISGTSRSVKLDAFPLTCGCSAENAGSLQVRKLFLIQMFPSHSVPATFSVLWLSRHHRPSQILLFFPALQLCHVAVVCCRLLFMGQLSLPLLSSAFHQAVAQLDALCSLVDDDEEPDIITAIP